MSAEIDYVAVRDDLKKRIEQLQAALVAVEGIIASSSGTGYSSGSLRLSGIQDVAKDEFLGMTIHDAAKRYLEMIRSPQSITQIWEAVKQGGLPHAQYNAVYNAIWRRESPKGDFFRPDESGSQWGLAEWYPTLRKAKAHKNQESGSSAKKVSKNRKRSSKKRKGINLLDGSEQILRHSGQPEHINVLISNLKEVTGKTTNVHSLSSSLRQDSRKRFTNLGKNTWALVEWPDEIKNLRSRENVLPL